MAEETPAEREERLQRQEERLAKQHERLSNPPPPRGSGGGGKFFGNIASFFGEHKVLVLGIAVGFGVVALVMYLGRRNQSSPAATGQDVQGSLGNAGYQDQGVAYGLTQLSQQMDNLQLQLDRLNNPASAAAPPPATPPPTTTNPPPGTTNPPGGSPPPPGTTSPPPTDVNSILPPGLQAVWNAMLAYVNSGQFTKPARIPDTFSQGPIITGGQPPGGSSVHKHKIKHNPKNNQANKSPIMSYLPLSDRAVPGTDLSHASIGGWNADPVHSADPVVAFPFAPNIPPPVSHPHIPHSLEWPVRPIKGPTSDAPFRFRFPVIHPMPTAPSNPPIHLPDIGSYITQLENFVTQSSAGTGVNTPDMSLLERMRAG